jgi:hypothetical protein
LPEAEFNRWIDAVQPVIDAYVKDMVGKGFAESEVRSWIAFINQRKAALLEKQKVMHLMSTTGPPEVRR